MLKVNGQSPTIERVGSLKKGDCFWKKRDLSLYTIVKDNCWTRDILKIDGGDDKVVVYNFSLNIITTTRADEWVTLAQETELLASSISQK